MRFKKALKRSVLKVYIMLVLTEEECKIRSAVSGFGDYVLLFLIRALSWRKAADVIPVFAFFSLSLSLSLSLSQSLSASCSP